MPGPEPGEAPQEAGGPTLGPPSSRALPNPFSKDPHLAPPGGRRPPAGRNQDTKNDHHGMLLPPVNF